MGWRRSEVTGEGVAEDVGGKMGEDPLECGCQLREGGGRLGVGRTEFRNRVSRKC
jgi:hypothetical protein